MFSSVRNMARKQTKKYGMWVMKHDFQKSSKNLTCRCPRTCPHPPSLQAPTPLPNPTPILDPATISVTPNVFSPAPDVGEQFRVPQVFETGCRSVLF